MNGDSEDLRRMTPPDYPRELSLLSENQRLREDNRKLAEEVGSNAVAVVGLQAEIERLREALRYYANQDNYYTMSMMFRKKPEDEYPPIWNDRGATARAALE